MKMLSISDKMNCLNCSTGLSKSISNIWLNQMSASLRLLYLVFVLPKKLEISLPLASSSDITICSSARLCQGRGLRLRVKTNGKDKKATTLGVFRYERKKRH